MATRLQEQRREERHAMAALLDPGIKAGIDLSLELATDAMTDRISAKVQASLGATIAIAVKESMGETRQQLADISNWRLDLDAKVANLHSGVAADHVLVCCGLILLRPHLLRPVLIFNTRRGRFTGNPATASSTLRPCSRLSGVHSLQVFNSRRDWVTPSCHRNPTDPFPTNPHNSLYLNLCSVTPPIIQQSVLSQKQRGGSTCMHERDEASKLVFQ
jgi:hypothetical protein